MNLLASGVPILGGQIDQLPTPVLSPSQKDARLFKGFTDGADAVGETVLVPLGGIYRRDRTIVEIIEVAAWEDVCRGEACGCADAVEEEDLILGGEEDDRGARSRDLRGLGSG